jgi:hypothetical protein
LCPSRFFGSSSGVGIRSDFGPMIRLFASASSCSIAFNRSTTEASCASFSASFSSSSVATLRHWQAALSEARRARPVFLGTLVRWVGHPAEAARGAEPHGASTYVAAANGLDQRVPGFHLPKRSPEGGARGLSLDFACVMRTAHRRAVLRIGGRCCASAGGAAHRRAVLRTMT